MVDYDVLKHFGTTDDRLREFFTAQQPSPEVKAKMTEEEIRTNERDIKNRKKFEEMIQGWLQEHIVFSLNNHAKYSAVDMAWDSMPINKQIMPLMQYAQGRVNPANMEKWANDLPGGSERYVTKDDKGKVTGINLPKFFEVNVNLIRSVITRRHAAQVVKYSTLWPYYKYEARDSTSVGKLRADMVSQRMDIMADQYGYRHFQNQVTRDMFLYAHSVAFPRACWERDVQVVREKVAKEFDSGELKLKTQTVREGVSWVSPHPSRIFYDNAYPLSSLNTDTGCEFVGFWDVCRFGDISNNGAYFNRKHVSYTSGMVDWFSTYWVYFNQYFSHTIQPPPSLTQENNGENPGAITATNDRKNQIGLFTGQMEQISTIFSHLWVKVRPSNWAWGTYPHPVWVHLRVAGDSTVVLANICPSSPAAVFSHNEKDDRLVNISEAHALMPFQDQLTNLYSQMLEVVKQDLFSVAILNTDVFPDTEEGNKVRDEFRSLMYNKATYASTQMLEISFQKLGQLGIKPEQAFTVVRSHPNQNIEQIFKAITATISMAEKMMVMSQHEQGQAASHEISAHESVAISQSTDNVYDFISESIDEGRAAMKRICFESLIACGDNQVELTVSNRYPKSTVTKAGFTVKDPDGDDPTGYTQIMGDKMSLVHDFLFTSRDGGNRPAGQAAATALIQLLQSLGSLNPELQNAVFSALGKEQLFDLINQIVRSVDAGTDIKFELAPGEDNTLVLSENKQVMQSIQQLASAVHKDASGIQAILAVLSKTNPQAAQMVQQAMSQPPQAPQPPQQ